MWKQNIITYIIAYIHYIIMDYYYKYYWLHYSIFLVMHYYKKKTYTFDQNNIPQITNLLYFIIFLMAGSWY